MCQSRPFYMLTWHSTGHFFGTSNMVYPPVFIISTHTWTPYKTCDVITFVSSFWAFHVRYNITRHWDVLLVFTACSLKFNFEFSCKPRYLILGFDVISTHLILTLMGIECPFLSEKDYVRFLYRYFYAYIV